MGEFSSSMAKPHRVRLSGAERTALRELTTKGVGGAQRHRRARVLLLADAGRSDQAIADGSGPENAHRRMCYQARLTMSTQRSKFGRRYDEEFKREVAALAARPESTDEQVARDLGVSPWSVS